MRLKYKDDFVELVVFLSVTMTHFAYFVSQKDEFVVLCRLKWDEARKAWEALEARTRLEPCALSLCEYRYMFDLYWVVGHGS